MSHFNEKAKEWDNENKIKLMSVLAKKTLEELKITEKIDILDFGCGTGLFGLEMADYAKTLVGIDTSGGMLDVFNTKTEGHSHIKSVNIDLEKEAFDEKFDLIISSMTFHHLENPKKMIGRLKEMLKKNGSLAIVDLDKEDGSFHPDNQGMGVKHYGFSEDELSSWAKESNFNFKHKIINSLGKNNREYHQFLAIYY